ncbi:ribonuclease P protein subunit p20 [Haemorhous mexicanus]|uniref:ribonuclease P protein subunit p20 n=1 Tax=Haemorhous mexicanus TaxID=30427 RepID=UPI0028BF0EAF|nr:ribonuclease P protein subunit p20 [Haemorhous mexicanus]
MRVGRGSCAMGGRGAPPVGPKKIQKPRKMRPGARGGVVLSGRCSFGGGSAHGGVAPGEAWPRGGSGGGAGRARMSSGRAAAPSPPPGGLPGLPPRRRRRGPAPGPPPGSPSPPAVPGSNDVFVTSRSDFRAQLRRCQRLLAPGGGPGGPGELRLHGLGLAVPRTINLALQLQAGAGGALRLHASTSSVPLRDRRDRHRDRPDRGHSGDREDPDGDPPRHNSAIHIRLCREAPCA